MTGSDSISGPRAEHKTVTLTTIACPADTNVCGAFVPNFVQIVTKRPQVSFCPVSGITHCPAVVYRSVICHNHMK